MSELVLRSEENGLCTLTLNRPDKLNALNHAVFESLAEHVTAIENNIEKTGCVLVRGVGRSFCAGHDLDDIAGGEPMQTQRLHGQIIERLANLLVPVVAAVQGHCLTGGLEFALAADIIIATETAQFADTHGKWDLVPAWGGSQRLPRRIGLAKAREMSFTSHVYSGRDAHAMGLANICVLESSFESAIKGLVDEVLANSWRANREAKRLYLETESMSLKAGLAHELYRTAGRGPEMRERLKRLREK